MNSWFQKTGRASAAITLLVTFASTLNAGGLIDTSLARFLAEDFSDSASITNSWWTLAAGSNFLYFAEDGGECAWNLVEVLDDTTDDFPVPYNKLARIILDREWIDEDCEYAPDVDNFADVVAKAGDAVEKTYDWYAQDGDGNIWYLGEDTRNSQGSSGGSFVAGCDGAEGGIVMLGDPHSGDFYRQEYYAGVAEDWGKATAFLKVDSYVCLKTKEWSPLSKGHIEYKFYCSDGDEGVLLMVDELKGKTVRVELLGSVDAGDVPNAPQANPAPDPTCP